VCSWRRSSLAVLYENIIVFMILKDIARIYDRMRMWTGFIIIVIIYKV
jgi:hypothetical protein